MTRPPHLRIASALLAALDTHPTASIFAIALVLRFAAVVWLAHVPYDQGGDAPHYLSIARDVLAGRAYGESSGDTTRVPVYQLFLSIHLWAFGGALRSIAVTQALLDSATAVMMTATAQALLPGSRRWVVGLLWATYPPAILNAVVIFAQPVQIFWLVGSVLLLVTGLKRQSAWRCVSAALLWSLSCLTREGNLLFLPVVAAMPLAFWGFGPGSSARWAFAVSISMLVVGGATLVLWTGRDFTKSYRLEYLLLHPTERKAIALLLRPVEPVHSSFAAYLRHNMGANARKTSTAKRDAIPTPALMVDEATREWLAEVRRSPTKLWQSFGAPDGTVQLACAGPARGFWATFRGQIPTDPLRAGLAAFSRPCLALKSFMYVEHYVLLALALAGLVMLGRALTCMSLFFLAYAIYTVSVIVLGSNYGNNLAAVPRFAYSFTPVLVLLAGLVLLSLRKRAA